MKTIIEVSGKRIIISYIITFIFSILGALINFWFFRAALIHINEESFYYYSYARRVISFISPVLLLGLGIAIPRSIGLYFNDYEKVKKMFISALSIILVVSALWYIINLCFNNWMTFIIWGDINPISIKLNKTISLYFIGLNLTACLHSYFRGKIKVFYAGLLELIALTIIPLVAFLYLTDLVKIYNFISLSLIILNIFIIIGISKNGFKISFSEFAKESKKILGYGLMRVPGDIAFALLIFLPAFIASKKYGLEYAGIIGFGMALITLANLPATAISFVSLSRFTHILKTNKSELKKEITYIVLGSFVYGIIASFILYLSIDYFVTLFLNDSILEYIDILKLMLWAITPYIIFTIVRSLIDAAYKKPYNSYNIIISTIIFLVFSLFSLKYDNISGIIYGIIFSYTVLAVLSLLKTIKLFKSEESIS